MKAAVLWVVEEFAEGQWRMIPGQAFLTRSDAREAASTWFMYQHRVVKYVRIGK